MEQTEREIDAKTWFAEKVNTIVLLQQMKSELQKDIARLEAKQDYLNKRIDDVIDKKDTMIQKLVYILAILGGAAMGYAGIVKAILGF